MSLERATIDPTIDHWSDNLSSAWTAQQKTRVAERLIAISRHLVPHCVDDIALPQDLWQAYLLRTTIGAVEDYLVEAAAGLRRYYQISAPRFRQDSGDYAIGLRAASLADLDTIPGIGAARAEDIARFLAQKPDGGKIEDLTEISGIGGETVEGIKSHAYLGQASSTIVVGAMVDFAMNPTLPAFLRMLEDHGASFFFGDFTAFVRRAPHGGGSVAERFLAFVDTVAERASFQSVAVDGTLASDAKAKLARSNIWSSTLQGMHPVDGELLINEVYADRVKTALDSAQSSIDLMMFLTTDAAGVDGQTGPKDLIDALIAAHGRGVTARVILDQDDDGFPYHSAIINAEVFRMLQSAGVPVKFDEKDVLLHSKLCVIDEQVVIVGAHNWTRAGFFSIYDVSLALNSPDIANDYRVQFEDLWNSLPP